jgi:hypothetical protein
LAELVRYLIYATGAEHRAAALPEPADGHAVVKNLRAAAKGQRLYSQLAEWAEGLAYNPDLRQRRLPFENGDFPAAAERARPPTQAFRHAFMYSAELSASLTRALDHLAPLYHEH